LGGSGQQGQLLCQNKVCKLITTNFKSQYSQTQDEGIGTDIVSEVSKTVGGGVSAAGSATRGVSGVGSGTVSGGLGGLGGLGGPWARALLLHANFGKEGSPEPQCWQT
jgi:hypothetical protein